MQAGGVVVKTSLALGLQPAKPDQLTDVVDGLLLGQIRIGLVASPTHLRASEGLQWCVDHPFVQSVTLRGLAEVDPGAGEQIVRRWACGAWR